MKAKPTSNYFFLLIFCSRSLSPSSSLLCYNNHQRRAQQGNFFLVSLLLCSMFLNCHQCSDDVNVLIRSICCLSLLIFSYFLLLFLSLQIEGSWAKTVPNGNVGGYKNYSLRSLFYILNLCLGAWLFEDVMVFLLET